MNNLPQQQNNQPDIGYFKGLAQVAISGGCNMSEATLLNLFIAGHEMGIPPMTALNSGFHVLNGKSLVMSTAMMASRIRRAGHSIKIHEWTDKKCVLIGSRKDSGDSIKVEYTIEDAARAGLDHGSVWKKHPKNMLYNRAMSTLARVLFSDVVGNCYGEDEGEEIKGNYKRIPNCEMKELREKGDVREIEESKSSYEVGKGYYEILIQELTPIDLDSFNDFISHCCSFRKITHYDFCREACSDLHRFKKMFQAFLDKKNKPKQNLEVEEPQLSIGNA